MRLEYGSVQGGKDFPLAEKDSAITKSRFLRQYRELYPSLLTISLFAIFTAPMINGVRLSEEPNARYWVGQMGYGVLAIPPILIFTHIVQSYYRRPLYFSVILSCAVPPLLLLVIGYNYMVPVNQIVSRLLSTDCTTFQTKFRIEQAYKQANSFYNDCLNAEAKNRSTTVEVVRKDTLISQCPDYNPKASGYEREWMYLQSLENTENCAGWCFVGEGALWTHNPLQWDSCAAAAGTTMKNTVAANAARMMETGIIGFGIAVLLIFLINEWMMNSTDPDFQW